MDKTILMDFIKKYRLGGMIEHIVWNIDDKGFLSAKCISSDKSIVLEVSSKKRLFIGKKLQNQKLGIYNTPKLMGLLSPLTDTIKFGLNGTELKVYDDEDTKMSFIVSHHSQIPTPPELKNLPDDFEVDFTLDTKFIDKMIKSYGCYKDWETFTILHKPSGKSQIVLGYSPTIKSNVIKLAFDTPPRKNTMDKISFALVPFVEFLKSHQDCDNIRCEISTQGLCRLTTDNKNFNSTAYLVSTTTI